MYVAEPGRLLLGLLLLLLPLLRGASGAWDPDLELLDLVEETPQTFYQLLSVDQVWTRFSPDLDWGLVQTLDRAIVRVESKLWLKPHYGVFCIFMTDAKG
ncbi:hypothetical protein NL108_014801 [Boleophthalmus pectinirostris]|nr:hypothetical protein NL108_014801 [Boleophthalmus pectinirostris]